MYLIKQTSANMPSTISDTLGKYFHKPAEGVTHTFSFDSFLYLYEKGLLESGSYIDPQPKLKWTDSLRQKFGECAKGPVIREIIDETEGVDLTFSESLVHKRYLCEELPLVTLRDLADYFLPFHAVLSLLLTVKTNCASSSGIPLSITSETWVPLQIKKGELRILRIARLNPIDFKWTVFFAKQFERETIPSGKVILLQT